MNTEAPTTPSSPAPASPSPSSPAPGVTPPVIPASTATVPTVTPTAPSARPDWLPEKYFDATKGPNFDEFGKHYNEIMTRDAAEQSRRLALPSKPEEVKLELPKDFQLPQGMEFKLDPSMPEYSKMQAAAVKHGLSPEAISDLVSIYAETKVGSQATIDAAHAAEVAKLGANGPARITALETFFTGLVGKDAAQHIKAMAVNSPMVQALEGVAAKFASQGAASFSQSHREPPSGQKVSDEAYSKMSDREKMAYAAQFPQSQFQAA